MKRYAPYLLVCLFFVSSFLSPKGLLAAPYYQGKRITIVVGFAPGGGYDRMARLLAKYLPKYIPGEPTVIIENVPGGSSIIAANQVYVAKPHGLTIGSINRGLPIAQLLKVEGIKFDIMKYAWIGSTSIDTNVLCVRTDLPHKSYDDLKKAKDTLFMATGGPMTSSNQFGVLLKEFLHLNIKIVTYTNMADALLSIERKESDGTTSTYSSLRPLLERKVIRPVLRSRNSETGIEKLPVDEELTTDKMGKTLLGMRSITDQFGRPYVLPPGVPADMMNTLKDAFRKVAKDPGLLADSDKLMLPVQYLPGEEILP